LGVPVSAQPIFINYWDTGCKYAPACLTCPFSTCYHDDAETFREELGHRFEGHCGGSDKLNSGNGVLFTGSLT